MITTKTCADHKLNADFAAPTPMIANIIHLLIGDGMMNDFYAAMMIKAAELGTFYASDLYDAFAEVNRARWIRYHGKEPNPEFAREDYNSGAYMNAWRVNGLISPTGNEREVRLPLYDDVYRIVPAKEWRVNFTAEQVQKVLELLYAE